MQPFVELGVDYFMLDCGGFPHPTTAELLAHQVLPALTVTSGHSHDVTPTLMQPGGGRSKAFPQVAQVPSSWCPAEGTCKMVPRRGGGHFPIT